MDTLSSLSRGSTLSWLHASEVFLFIAGIILAVGIIGEIKTPAWSLPRLRSRLHAFEIMVLIGVMGELLGDGGVFLFSEHLQALSDAELQAAVIQAGNAQKTRRQGSRRR